MNIEKSASRQRGSALVYILIAIALLGLLTMSFMEPSSQQTTSQNSFKTVADLQGQIELIRSAIQECVLRYPNGDDTIDTADPSGTDPNANIIYPIKPNSEHYDAASFTPDDNLNVANIRCPGNPGDDPDHVKIFGGTSAKFLPPIVSLFEDWQYYNGTDGVFFWTQTNKTDAFLTTALNKLDDNYSECEADVIDATSGAVYLDSDESTDYQCAEGYTCFRIWVLLDDTADHQDSGCGATP